MSNAVIINNCEVEFEVANGEAFTTSLNVAEVFDKQHKHILAKIGEFPQDIFNGSNFRLVEYKDKKGESRPYYKISKDGFVLLAMSFTGERFYKFKVAYINAFNQMADEIKRLKFEKYINEVANLNACLIDKAKRHQRVVNGYKGKLKEQNNQIAILRHELAKPDNTKALLQHVRDERDYYKKKYAEAYKALGKDKTTEVILALDKIQKHLEPVYTALGAVMAYASDNDRFFMDRNEILR
ncbi:Rha family transcriptional regulator [Campylobacter concisus]|uniref:Rha family transcriptional regulator n=1 Tax=Campylobacter concisus TaxID=199 RepID=UPI0018AB5246|nr:Rha family transcriptional regulator [Campylobacter concisus]QPI03699.1 Rha family transcriptional regulator [Campylobacter concisus]